MALIVFIERRCRLLQSSQRWAEVTITSTDWLDPHVFVVKASESPFAGIYGEGCDTTLLAVASNLDMVLLPMNNIGPTPSNPNGLWRATSVFLSCNTEGEMRRLLDNLIADIRDNLENIQGYPIVSLSSTITTQAGTQPAPVDPPPIPYNSALIFELKNALKLGVGDYYTDIENDADDNPIRLVKWMDAAKTVKIFTKTITWVNGNPVSVVTVDETSGRVLTTTLTYDVDGNIISMIENIT